MAQYPSNKDDTVLYDKENVFGDQDITVRMLDGAILNIWGEVFVNGQPLAIVGSLPIATQPEAEAGVVNNVVMTPLRTAQAVDAQVDYVHVGPEAPTDPTTEFWWDTDANFSVDPDVFEIADNAETIAGTATDKVVSPAGLTAALEHYSVAIEPTGVKAVTLPRSVATGSYSPVSGTLYLVILELRAGDVINSITFVSGSAGITAPTNQWFGLFNASMTALAFTNNDTTAPWTANSLKTLSLTSPVTITTTGLYYIGIVQTASTPASLQSSAQINTGLGAAPPVIVSICNTGLTVPPALPFTATPGSVPNRMLYGYVS